MKPAPSISDILDRCYVGPNHYEWPRAGSGRRVDQVALVRALQAAFNHGDPQWPRKARPPIPSAP